MKRLLEKKNIIYIAIMLIILIGIICTCIFKLNFSLMYSENTRISIYLGKEYNLQDIKQIAKEIFETDEIIYQEIETFKDSIAITVKNSTEEQISELKTKLIEKYEMNSEEEFIITNEVAHLRGRDIVKPYIIPMAIVTIIILTYVGVVYSKLGIIKTIFKLLIRLVLSEALLLSIIAIVRVPITIYTMPVAIIIYLLVSMYTIKEYQNTLDKIKEAE